MSVEVTVPATHGERIVISYAGDDPVTYSVVDGRTVVEERHLDEFMAVVVGSAVAPPKVEQPVVGAPKASKEK